MELAQTVNGLDLLLLVIGVGIGYVLAVWTPSVRRTARYWYRLGLRHGHEDRRTVNLLLHAHRRDRTDA